MIKHTLDRRNNLLLAMGLVGISFGIIQWLANHIIVSINTTSSLPQPAFLVIKNQPVERGQYVAFNPPSNPFYSTTKPFIKIVGGIPGDTLSFQHQQFYVNGKFIGLVKAKSSKGFPLTPSQAGVLPHDEYFVYAPNPNSFDSRYQEMGWIHRCQFIGRAYPVF